jgi:hypothetical protein
MAAARNDCCNDVFVVVVLPPTGCPMVPGLELGRLGIQSVDRGRDLWALSTPTSQVENGGTVEHAFAVFPDEHY